jgi:hypothetical protein
MLLPHHPRWVILPVVISVLGAPGLPARAMSACSGEYSTAVFQPLPVPTVVYLNLHESSDPNTVLASAFTNGMRDAGVETNGPATVSLRVTYQVLGQGPTGNPAAAAPIAIGNTDTGWGAQWGDSQTWLDGGWNTSLPDLPRYDVFHPQQQAQPAVLVIRVEADNAQTGAIDWIGMVQCTVRGSNNQVLAYQLGRLIGGSFGKRVSRGPM